MTKFNQQAKTFDGNEPLHQLGSDIQFAENVLLTREQRIANISNTSCWDLVIIGGGITGAGILKLASQTGLKVLLLEQKDFAWGSSSRSSKMVHGGLRYMAQGQFALTRESVIERQRLLDEGQPLVMRHSFVMSHYQYAFPTPWIFNTLLSCYDFIAGIKQHRFWPKSSYVGLAPKVEEKKLIGGTQFFDALTEDARLVQRLIQESLHLGGQALNYAKVSKLKSQVADNQLEVLLENQTLSIKAKTVVNACGAWSKSLNICNTNSETINATDKKTMHMRPLRGSHLVIPNWRLPVASVVSILHAKDKRPVQVYPWQNVTIVGTTDVEHAQDMAKDARISQEEFDYLLAAVAQQFPDANITETDIISTFAGVRPVITSGEFTDPSKEKREHYIEQALGVISVTGGKLTTFRLIAEQVLNIVCQQLTARNQNEKDNITKTETDFITSLASACKQPILSKQRGKLSAMFSDDIEEQIKACYGEYSPLFVSTVDKRYCKPIRYSKHLWAELIWSVQFEQVNHLDDLLLRRTRIGNVLPNGACDLLPEIKQLCSPYLTWDEQRWQREIMRYTEIWQTAYSLPANDNNR